MCFLVGNDFVPSIPTLAILDGGIDSMIDVYKTVGRSYGHLTRISRKNKDTTIMFQKDALVTFLGTLAQYEGGLLEEKYNKKEDIIEDPICKACSYQVLTETGEQVIKIDFEKYKEKFYNKKLNISKDNPDINVEDEITNICEEYLRGLQWVMTYYKKGMPDWNWFYPEFYAPFLCDLTNAAKKSNQIDCETFITGNPCDPFLQLLCVMPPKSYKLLPTPLDNLIINDSSPLKKYYPEQIVVDITGKRQEWEGIVLLPNIDHKYIESYYKKYIKSVSELDKNRNKIKQSIKFRYKDDCYTYKSFYGEIEECRAEQEFFDI